MFLLGTDVLPLLRRPSTAPAMAAWLDGVADEELWLSTITIGEIAHRIASRQFEAPDIATGLADWLMILRARYADRIVPFGIPEAKLWSELAVQTASGSIDLMIVATALVRDLTLVTRDVAAHRVTGAKVLDPMA